jgi:hypothetical protein
MKTSEMKDDELENLEKEQQQINDLKQLYDTTYQSEVTRKVQSVSTPPPAPIKPSDMPVSGGGTRKHTMKSPKRRTLRRK